MAANAEAIRLAANNLKRSYVPEAIRIFEEDKELRRAYNKMRKAKIDQKKEVDAVKKGELQKLLRWHNQELRALSRATGEYREFFDNLFADMTEMAKLLGEQAKIDIQLKMENAPPKTTQQLVRVDTKEAIAFSRMMEKVSDLARALAFKSVATEKEMQRAA